MTFNQLVEKLIAHPNAPAMPANRHNLKSGSKITAAQAYPFLGIAEDEEIRLLWDGEYVRYMGLTWSVESMCNEIDHGLWVIK